MDLKNIDLKNINFDELISKIKNISWIFDNTLNQVIEVVDCKMRKTIVF